MKKSQITIVLSILLVCALLCACGSAAAPAAPAEPAAPAAPAEEPTTEAALELGAQPEGYPNGNITWIVPAAAGAAIDVPTRALIEQLDLGTNVTVENIAGASQTLGTAEAAVRDADGYTFLTGANGGMLLQPSLVDLTYDTFEDFRHIAMVASPDPMAIAVSSESAIKSFDELKAKLEDGERMTWSFSNAGGVGHLAMLDVLTQLGNTSAEFVPFNGSAEVITALLGGHIDFMVMDADIVATRAQQGQVTPLAVLSSEKFDSLPDTPSVVDFNITNMDCYQGYKWLAVRADTPDEIVEWLKVKVNEATQTEEYQKFLTDNNFAPLGQYSEEEVTQILKDSFDACSEMLTVLGLHK